MQLKVQIKTISNEHVEEFIRCPYKFYQRQLLLRKKQFVDWRVAVQLTAHQIINTYYNAPKYKRSSFYILQLIEHYWRSLKPTMFHSQIHYYDVLAKVSDYLLQFLSQQSEVELPLFVCEKYGVYVPELESNISLTIDFAQWTDSSYGVTKFIIDDQLDTQKMIKYFMVAFTKNAFQKLPEYIEFYSLLTGKRQHYKIEESDYEEAIKQLHMMKSVLEEPKFFQKTNSLNECKHCPLQSECSLDNAVETERMTMFM
ncbi:hypothetical protein FZC66_00175 [Priestia megaterium]|nr:hypothetical protein FZC66_00175 [Priestia megaterium]